MKGRETQKNSVYEHWNTQKKTTTTTVEKASHWKRYPLVSTCEKKK